MSWKYINRTFLRSHDLLRHRTRDLIVFHHDVRRGLFSNALRDLLGANTAKSTHAMMRCDSWIIYIHIIDGYCYDPMLAAALAVSVTTAAPVRVTLPTCSPYLTWLQRNRLIYIYIYILRETPNMFVDCNDPPFADRQTLSPLSSPFFSFFIFRENRFKHYRCIVIKYLCSTTSAVASVALSTRVTPAWNKALWISPAATIVETATSCKKNKQHK